MTCKNTFLATEVLAKHDENYMPPEVAEALQYTVHTKMKKIIPLILFLVISSILIFKSQFKSK